MIVYSDKYLLHDMEYHVENSKRLVSIMDYLSSMNVFSKIKKVEPIKANEEDVLLVHTQEVLEKVKNLSRGRAFIDMDTYVNEYSYEVALYAVGGVLKALMSNERYAFALVRPPGHHAERNASMGFCLFNNVAIGAKKALEIYKRVAIVDFDVHHGNGTQDIFYDSCEVLFISLHQVPLYPGTGRIDEIGIDEGRGFTINLPVPPGTCNKSYLKAFDFALDILEQFNPEVVFVSAGYDAHFKDPLANLNLTNKAYYEISEKLSKFRLIFSLEGGYNLHALPLCVYSSLAPLFNFEVDFEEDIKEDNEVEHKIDNMLKNLRNILRDYWVV